MRTRLSCSSATLIRCARCFALPNVTLTSANVTATTVPASPSILTTTLRGYQGQGGSALRTSGLFHASAANKKSTTAKTRTSRARKGKSATTATSSSGQKDVDALKTSSSPTKTKLEDETGFTEGISLVTPSPSAAAAEAPARASQRVLHLGSIVHEWSSLRYRCRLQRRYDLAVNSVSSGGVNVSNGTSVAAAASTGANGGATGAFSPAVNTRLSLMSTSNTSGNTTYSNPHSSNNGLDGGKDSNATEVHAAERTMLLSTLVRDAQAYPQLYAFFYPNSHRNNNSNSNNGNKAKKQTVVVPAFGTAATTTSLPSNWEVREVNTLVQFEACTIELLTLLRVHEHVAQQNEEAACLHNAVWSALVNALKAQLMSTLEREKPDGEKKVRTTATVTTAIAQVLHVLIDAYRDQLALGGGVATQEHIKQSTHGTLKRSSKKARQLQRQSRKDAFVHVRVARVLTELVAPLYGIAFTSSGNARNRNDASGIPQKRGKSMQRTESVPSAAIISTEPLADNATSSGYGASSTLVMVAAISALAEEAAGLLAHVPSTVSVTPFDVHKENKDQRLNWRAWRDTSLKCLFKHLEGQKTNTEHNSIGLLSSPKLSSTAADANAASAAAADLFVDLLRCLRWTEELEVVLRAATLSKVADLCQGTLLLICRAAAEGKALIKDVSVSTRKDKRDLFEYLCTPVVAKELNRLMPDRVTYAQVVTDLCSVASAYAQRQSPEQIAQLVDRLEKELQAALAAAATSSVPNTKTTRVPESCLPSRMEVSPSSSAVSLLPPHLPLRSPIVQLLYAMLCAGFAPSALLTSSLSLSLSPRDTLDVVHAIDLFSISCGMAALPVRTRSLLVDHVAQMLTQCRKDGHRVVFSSIDEEGYRGDSTHSFSLKARLADGATATTVAKPEACALNNESPAFAYFVSADSPRPRKRRLGLSSKKSKNAQVGAEGGGSGGGGVFAENTITTADVDSKMKNNESSNSYLAQSIDGVLTPAVYRTQVNHLFYVSTQAIVECILRGDVSGVERIGRGLLPLLQQEGREAALTEGLECIWAAFRQRLSELGSNERATMIMMGNDLINNAAIGQTQNTSMPPPTAPPLVMTAAMEDALAELTSLFLPHMTELAMKRLTSPNASAADSVACSSGDNTNTSPPSNPNVHDDEGNMNSKKTAGGSTSSKESTIMGVVQSHARALRRTENLMEMALRLSTIAVLCGMPANTVAQLTTLHNTLLKSHGRATLYEHAPLSLSTGAANGDGSVTATTNAVRAAFGVVERLERFLTDVTRQSLSWARHAQSAHVRNSGLAVQQVLATYIASTAGVVRDVTQSTNIASATAAAASLAVRQQEKKTISISSKNNRISNVSSPVKVSALYRHYLLTVMHLLYRLSTEFPVEAEPAALRVFRVEVLDPALTAVLLTTSLPNTKGKAPTTTVEAAVTDGDDNGLQNDLKSNKHNSSGNSSSVQNEGEGVELSPALQMPLTSLTEVVVVMCVPDSVQHVSPTLMRGVVAAVEQLLKARKDQQLPQQSGLKATTTPTMENAIGIVPVADKATGVLATQLLSAAATVCLRADDTLTSMLLQLLTQLGPLLTLWQTTNLLERLHATGAPLAAKPVRALLERVVNVLAASNGNDQKDNRVNTTNLANRTSVQDGISTTQQIRILHLLTSLRRTVDIAVAEQRWLPHEDVEVAALLKLLESVPYVSLLNTLVNAPRLQRGHLYTIGECGLLVEVVAHLLQTMETNAVDVNEGEAAMTTTWPRPHWTADEKVALQNIPRLLAAYVLQAVQLPFARQEVPQLLRGYAALVSAPQLQQQMLRAFIARTIRAAPEMSPSEVVACVEAYAAGGIVHEQLYGVLLGRAADLGRRLTLELSVRLLRCGISAGHASVRTVCVTAVQPIFSAQVRGLLQSDPHVLVSVACTALAVLHCLRDCFPHDDISAAVLTNAARYRHDASLSVVKAALELMERRGSVDYDVAHIFARHCTEAVLPTCSATELANVTCLLLGCGLRSSALLEAIYKRLGEVIETMPGSSLAKLAQGLLQASVEVDSTAVQLVCERVVALTLANPEDSTATASAATTRVEECQRDASMGKNARQKIKAASTKATNKRPLPTTVPSALPVLLTFSQVCIFLHLLRTVGRRHVTTAMETADALLLFAQRRVNADAAAATATRKTKKSVDKADALESPTDKEHLDKRATGRGAAAPPSPPESLPLLSLSLAPPLPVLADVHPREIEEMLRSCIDLSSKPKAFHPLVSRLADAMAYLLQEIVSDATSEGGVAATAASTVTMAHPSNTALTHRRARHSATNGYISNRQSYDAPSPLLAWQNDLILLVDLCSLFIRLGEASHPVVKLLFSVLYNRRGTLLQRALLLKTTKQSLEQAGRAAHTELYKLIVDGEIL